MFSTFLDRVITTESYNYSEEIFSQQTRSSLISIEINKCIFYDIITPSISGSAISTFGNIFIQNSEFQKIEGNEGGAIWASNNFTVLQSCFTDITASEGGCFQHQNPTGSNIIVKRTTFTETKAKKSAVFSISSGSYGKTIFSYNNFTNTHSDLEVGCGEISFSHTRISFCCFDRTNSKFYNGCIVSHRSNSFICSNSVFCKCWHSTKKKSKASALLFLAAYDKSILQIVNSTFDNCVSCSLAVPHGSPLTIENCCFSGSEQNEIANENKLIFVRNCLFDSMYSQHVNLIDNEEIGCVKGYIKFDIEKYELKIIFRKIYIHVFSVLISFGITLLLFKKSISDIFNNAKKPRVFD